MIDRFRREVYQSFRQRADTALDLIDALTSAMQVESPVALSESVLFRRGFGSIYDVLNQGELDDKRLREVLDACQPEDAETIAGYEVYAVDCTDDPAAEAETLADRSQSKKGRYAPTVVGHRYSWLVRLVAWRTSWCMPQDIERVATTTTDSQGGAEQVGALAERNPRPKVVVADSLYANAVFLRIFLLVQYVYALVRLRSNQVLYEEPPEREPGQRGRPRKHGCKFKLSAPWRTPDRVEETELLGQRLLLQAWTDLHLYKLPFLVGMVVSVQFLKADGTPRFQRPLSLFWTGPPSIALVDLARIYLWRFAIEHMFRFLKQQMGLTCTQSPDLVHRQRWIWCCALAYCQLLLMRHAVADHRPAWHPRQRRGTCRPLTPRLVQRQALTFLLSLGSPARPAHPAGKGRGRPPGFRPEPRRRYQVIKKSKKRRTSA
ncbi:MAG TPA: transposase [Chloroflexota bacterium]|nr:transposase [Chloroflexota bacterium]